MIKMNKKNIVFFLIILICQITVASEVDSLKQLLNKTSNKKLRIDLLNELAGKYYYINFDSLMLYAGKAYTESISTGYVEGEVKSLLRKCDYYINVGDYKTAVDLVKQAEPLSEKKGDKELLANTYVTHGDIYASISIFDIAFEYYTHARGVFNEIGKKTDVIMVENRMGGLFALRGNTDKALEVFEQALKNAKIIDDNTMITQAMMNIAAMYSRKGKNDESLELYQSVFNSLGMRNNDLLKSTVLSNIASIYRNKGDSAIALDYYNRALFQTGDDSTLRIRNIILLRRGHLFKEMNKPRYAEKDLKKVFLSSIHADWPELAMQSALFLSDIYEKQNKFEQSLNFQKEYVKYLNIVESEGNTKKMAELEVKYDFEKETLKIEASNRRRTILLVSALVLSVMAIILIVIILVHIRTLAARARLQHENEILEKEKVEQNLTNQLEIRNKEITSNILLLQKKNEILTTIADRLINAKDQFTESNKKFIERCINDLLENADDSDWKNFEVQFNQVYESFYQKLDEINPDLTVNDRRLCAYLRLKMTTKEIAILTNLNVHSVEGARYRLRKKLNVTDPNVSLGVFLEHL